MDVLQARVAAHGQDRAAERDERAVVAQIARVRPEPGDDRADAIEFAAGTEGNVRRRTHRPSAARRARLTSPLSVATQRYRPLTARSRTGAGRTTSVFKDRDLPRGRFQ